ncbi:MAG TPA: general stress protein [Chloroflexota bacterium]|nr:general stress protein [Chloroflexota bacterium]
MQTAGQMVVFGMFRDQEHAQNAVTALRDAGFAADSVGVLMRHPDRTFTGTEGQKTDLGVGGSAVAGGVLGAIAGWLVGLAAFSIPGVGPFVAAGIWATTIGGAALGAGVGAVTGAIADLGVSQERAKWYGQEIQGGSVLVSVFATGREGEAENILNRNGAYDTEVTRPVQRGAV